MDYNQIAKKVIDSQKLAFSNYYKAVAMVQDQATSAMEKLMAQATWVPEDNRKAVKSWVNLCQEERGRFKSYVDAGFVGLEKTFTKESQAAPAKTAPKN